MTNPEKKRKKDATLYLIIQGQKKVLEEGCLHGLKT